MKAMTATILRVGLIIGTTIRNSVFAQVAPPIASTRPSSSRVSVWPTRAQDYVLFCAETKRQWTSTNFKQEPNHPAVNVTWHDASEFCQWLTAKERAGLYAALDKLRARLLATETLGKIVLPRQLRTAEPRCRLTQNCSTATSMSQLAAPGGTIG